MSRTRVVVPASPLLRYGRAAGALLLLAGLIVGLPAALTLLAGDPLPALPAPGEFWSTLTSPDDGTLFLALLTVLGWLAWAGFTGSVLLELFARATGRPAPAVPGLRGPRRVASFLIAAIAALAVAPTITSASASVVTTPAAVVIPLDQSDPAIPAPDEPAADHWSEPVVHVVARGEGLLDLQDRYGIPWQRIAEVNYAVAQPDGRSLQRGQTRIYPGWELRIPTSAAVTDPDPAGDIAPVARWGTAPVDQSGAAESAPAAPPSRAESGAESGADQRYEVAEGDWLWHIADRYLGDPLRYQEIAELNPAYADQHGDFPDHIEPGWSLALPEDAADRGSRPHATGAATPAEAAPAPPERPAPPEQPAPEQPPSPEPAPAPPEQPAPADQPTPAPVEAGDALHPPPLIAGLGEATADPVPEQAPPVRSGFGQAPERADQAAAADESGLERFAPVALASAGLLSALVLGAAGHLRRRRHQHHRPGFRFALPAQRLERVLHLSQQPLDAARLDAALRHLAAGLAGRADLPDIAGVLVDEGTIHLLLVAPCAHPPAPWREHDDRWTLPAGAPLPAEAAATLAPLPLLTAVGSQAGLHLLLDLERLGFLRIHGQSERTRELLRYLAAELACHSWSDTAELLVAGFPAAEAEALAVLSPDRVRPVTDVAAAVTLLRQRLASARATLVHTAAGDPLTGRVHRLAGDAWLPQVLLVADPSPPELVMLSELAQELTGIGRCAVAVATTDSTDPTDPTDPAHPEQLGVSVTGDGTVQVHLPFLRTSMRAAGLSAAELATLAETVQAARSIRLAPVPSAPEPDTWAVATDAAGAVRSVGQARVGAPPSPDPDQTQVLSPAAPAEWRADGDAALDEDLQAWFADAPLRPRISVLGPVRVDAPGPPPETRRRLHTELIVFLAERAGRGADGPGIAAALWPDLSVAEATRQLVIGRVRRWLGTGPDGRAWLPDVGPDLHYRLAEGCLCDWHLFRRLRTRAQLRGAAGVEDLRTALRLVRGVPLDGATHPPAPGTRNPYPWVWDSDLRPDHLVAAIVDTAHQLAAHCLTNGDPAGARWAVGQAWLADPERSYDQPWRDLLRAEQADGQIDQVRRVLAELLAARDAETPEDLSPETYQLLAHWPPGLLTPVGSARA